MSDQFADRILETTTVTGTGPATLLGAPVSFRAFSAQFTVGDDVYYAIVGQSGSAEWEVGYGVYSSANTLTRTTVQKSSNANAAVNFSAGTKDVFVTIPSERANNWATQGRVVAQISGSAMP